MNYRTIDFKKGGKYLGFWWHVVVELILIGIAATLIFEGQILEAFVVFILIEIREINCKLKDS